MSHSIPRSQSDAVTEFASFDPICRVKYEQTIADLKRAVEKKTGVPADKQQLFWHHKELTAAYDNKTLLDLNLHTGFSLKGYNLVCYPDFAHYARHAGSCATQPAFLQSMFCSAVILHIPCCGLPCAWLLHTLLSPCSQLSSAQLVEYADRGT